MQSKSLIVIAAEEMTQGTKRSEIGTTEVYLHLQQDEAIDEVRKKMKDRFFRIGEEVRIECRAN